MSDEWYTDQRRQENLLNGLDRNLKIYRVFSFKRFLQTIQSKEIFLVKPSLWDDPFENFLLYADVKSQNGVTVSLGNVGNSYFGQCWTWKEESDAIWRIYSHDKDSIKVSTTVGKLYDYFFNHHALSGKAELGCFFGKVEYKPVGDIFDILSDPIKVHDIVFDSTGIRTAQSLLIKRKEFEHEHEVRIIYKSFDEEEKSKSSYAFPIDPNQLFDEIVFDPRVSKSDFSIISKTITALGCTVPMSKSTLYEVPNIDIRLPVSL